MATKRLRNGSWAYTVKRKGVLSKPVYLTFDDEPEGDLYVAHLEKLLDQGIVPPELQDSAGGIKDLRGLIVEYNMAVALPVDDRKLLSALVERSGHTFLTILDYAWCEKWITEMKRVHHLSPTTIRHYVGALARCLDWAVKKGRVQGNPLRMLPKRYASYTDTDSVVVAPRVEQHRDRRLSETEEKRVRSILAGEKPEGRQRPLDLHHKEALVCLFELAIETAMRLREMYTLESSQVVLKDRTIFLEKTKNGDKRQVPLTSNAIAALQRYGIGKGLIFPWWKGEVGGKVLESTTSRLSRQFSRIFDAAGCPEMRFHDLRHEATSRFFERTQLSDLEIAKITGHKDPKVLMRYANLRGSDLAGKLW